MKIKLSLILSSIAIVISIITICLASYRSVHRLFGVDYWNIGSPCNSSDRVEHLYDYRF